MDWHLYFHSFCYCLVTYYRKMTMSGLNAQNIWSISCWNNSGLCWTPSASRSFFFFFLNHCVSVNTDALHFHKLNYIYAQTKYYSCKKCFISHYDWAGVILMQHTWDKLVPCGQITSEIFGFAPRPPFPPLFYTVCHAFSITNHTFQ